MDVMRYKLLIHFVLSVALQSYFSVTCLYVGESGRFGSFRKGCEGGSGGNPRICPGKSKTIHVLKALVKVYTSPFINMFSNISVDKEKT